MFYLTVATISQTIERVKKIKPLNRQGIIPEELEVVDLSATKTTEAELEFVDVVGHINEVWRKLIKNVNKKNIKKNKDHNKGSNLISKKGKTNLITGNTVSSVLRIKKVTNNFLFYFDDIGKMNNYL